MGKLSKLVKTVQTVKNSENPAQAAGNLAAGAAMVAHPIVGSLAAPLIRKGVTAAVDKGMEVAHDPAVQARAREMGSQVQSKVQSGVRDIGANIATRVQHFQDARGGINNG